MNNLRIMRKLILRAATSHFLRILLLGLGVGWAHAAPEQTTCDLRVLTEKDDYAAATACVKAGADPNIRDSFGRGPLNRLLWSPHGLSVLNEKTLPFIVALVDAGADLNHRPPNQEGSAFEALLEFGVHITAHPLMRRMLMREKDPVDLNASVSMRRSPPHDERRLTPLLWAIKVGDVEIAALLLKRGADPNQIPTPGMGTPLHHAVHYNQPEIIRLLHRHGADIRSVSPAPILDAINSDRVLTGPETLRAALELGALAAIEKQEAWLQRALSSHKPLTETQFLILAPYLKIDFANPQSRFLEQLLENNWEERRRNFGKNLPALQVAFLHALATGANPNGSRWVTKVGASLLQMLCKLEEGDLTLEKNLLDRGANPNLADKDGDTPLHQIAIDRVALKTQLAALPPIPNDPKLTEIWSRDTLKSLLDEAAGNAELAEAYKKAYWTKAMHERIHKRLDRLNEYEQLLLAHGANPTLKNRMGKTPSDIDAGAR